MLHVIIVHSKVWSLKFLFSNIVLIIITTSTFDVWSIEKFDGNNFHTWENENGVIFACEKSVGDHFRRIIATKD